MKKIVLSLFILSTVFAYSQGGVCTNFHRNHCGFESKGGGDKWLYNAQSRSGLFTQGMTSKIRCVIYKGMDYRMIFCCETQLGDKLNYKVFDARTNELLYDNATAKGELAYVFQSNATRQLVIEVTVPKGSTEQDKHKPADAACVGLLIEHRLTDRQGFSSY